MQHKENLQDFQVILTGFYRLQMFFCPELFPIRCGDCEGESESPVCGSDGKTYPSACVLENYACRKYWDISMVSQVDF